MIMAKLFVSREVYEGLMRGADRILLPIKYGPLANYMAASEVDALLVWVQAAYPELIVCATCSPTGDIVLQFCESFTPSKK